MSGMLGAFMGALTSRGPATLDADFGSVNGAGTATSATRTVTVPGGGSRSLNFGISLQSTDSVEYQKNGGSWTTITDGLDVDFSHGDTIAIRTSGDSTEGAIIVVTDNVFSTTVGTFSGTID